MVKHTEQYVDTHTYTPRFARVAGVAFQDKRTPLGIPSSWAGQKSEKNVLLSGDAVNHAAVQNH